MSKSRTIKIKYFDNEIDRISKIDKGDWIDLRAAETVELQAGEFTLIPLGVGMILPEGYEAHVVPRSSTFKTYGVLQTNSMGVIDNSYCGEDDQWYFPAYATRVTTVHKNDRICQFRIQKKQPEIEFEEVEHLEEESRGGFGSTGISTYDEDDEFEAPNDEYEAVEGIILGFEVLYSYIKLKTYDFTDRDDINYNEERWKRGIMQALEFLLDRSKEFSGEERVKREHQIRSMANCFIDILAINIKFLELESEDISPDVISRFGEVCAEIHDEIRTVMDVAGGYSKIGSADEFRVKYTEAVQGLTDILGEDNILATQEHIDNMVATYVFFIDARREYSLREEQHESD